MSHPMQQVPTSIATLLDSEEVMPQKFTPEDGLQILKDLGPAGERKTRAARDEGLKILADHFGVSGAEIGSLILAGTQNTGWYPVLECLKRRQKDHHKNTIPKKRLQS